ncbi:MAG: hypothetical protein H6737_14790 [Alphaproteobacteria bacterium]|nr:hypothetical protein [Alphaproteobacteria bacterium]
MRIGIVAALGVGCAGTCGTSDVFDDELGDLLVGMPEQCGRVGSFGHQHPEEGRAVLWIVPDPPPGLDLLTFAELVPSMTLDFPLDALDDGGPVAASELGGDADVVLSVGTVVVPLVSGELEVLGRAGKTALGDPLWRVRWEAVFGSGAGGPRFETEGRDRVVFRPTSLPYEPPLTGP